MDGGLIGGVETDWGHEKISCIVAAEECRTEGVARMARVVQKFGGSSVADADSIKRVAKRIVATKQAGHEVVVVISAMGDTTDELMDLAFRVR